MSQNKYKKLGKNTAIVFIGNFGSKFMSFFMLPFYTSWLSVEDYGTSDLINSYATLLLGVVSCCITESVFIFPKGQSLEKQKSYFTTAFGFSVFAIFVSGLIAFFLAKADSNSLFFSGALLIWGILSSAFFQVLILQFCRSIDRMFVYGFTGILQTLCVFVFALFFIPQKGVYGYVLSIVFANITAGSFSFFVSKAYKFLKIGCFNVCLLKQMLSYSIPLIPNGVMFWLVSTLNRPLMEHYCGLFYIGLYAVAMKIPSIISAIFNVLYNSWQISVLDEFGKETYSDFYNKVLYSIFNVFIILFFGLCMVGPFIIKVLTREEYYAAIQYIPLLLLGTIISSLSSLVGTNFSAAKKSHYFLYSTLTGALSSVLFNFFLIPSLKVWGALLSSFISFSLMSIVRVYFSWQYVKLDKIVNILIMFGMCMLYCLAIYILNYNNYSFFLGLVAILIICIINYKELMDLKRTICKKILNK